MLRLVDRRILPPLMLIRSMAPGTPHDQAGQGAPPLPAQADRLYSCKVYSFRRLCGRDRCEREQFNTLRTLV